MSFKLTTVEQRMKIKHVKLPMKLSNEVSDLRAGLEIANESLNELYRALAKVEDDLEKLFVRVDILEIDEEL